MTLLRDVIGSGWRSRGLLCKIMNIIFLNILLMENRKILIAVLIWAVSLTWLTYASVDENSFLPWRWMQNFARVELTEEQKLQMEEHRSLMEKLRNGETLTEEEQVVLDETKNTLFSFWIWKWMNNGRWGMMWEIWGKKWMWIVMWDITDEEKTALESMTDEEKQAFFESKKEELRARQESHENVIDKLLAWESLTSEEEIIRQEIIQLRTERKEKMINFDK